MLPKFSVKKPMTIVVAMILIVLLGVISFTKMTTDLLPSINLPYVMVMTSYPGASPEKVESDVTKPLENTLATTSGIKSINSISNENSSMIILEFNQETNMDSAIIEMNSKLDIVKSSLSDGVGTPVFSRINPDMLPVMIASVDVDGKDIKETSGIVEKDIVPQFEKIDGVASVTSTGSVEEKIKVQLNDEKIDAINDKVLASVDSKLADGKAQIDAAKAKLKESEELLDKEGTIKTQELVDASQQLSDGKDAIKNALNNLPYTETQLSSQLETLTKERDVLDKLIQWQKDNGVDVPDDEQKALDKFNDSISQIEGALDSIKEKKPDLEEKLESISQGEKQLEVGKLTLNRELTKAAVTISMSKAELEEKEKEFESSKEEAYKKAGIKDNITKSTISGILKAENFSMPAGYINEGGEKYLVKVGDEFSSREELENLMLFDIDVEGVGPIYLRDVADITLSDNSDDLYAKINGNDGIVLSIQKQSTSSTSDVSSKINDEIKSLCAENEGLHITPLQDQGIYIDIVIKSVISNLIMGGILAVIILFVFLRNIRPTIIIAFSIPISLMFALTMMYFSGVTMNIISLSGLALGVGMLVDNSIVVIENIYRLRNEGVSAAKAAAKGAAQVSGAIFASTLTTICVFLPIVFTNGLSRQLFTDMGLTIAYSLIASLIIALTLVPTMASKMINKADDKEHAVISKILNLYEKFLNRALNHRGLVMGSVTVILVLSVVAALSKGAVLIPDMDSKQISVTMNMPYGSTVQETRDMSDNVIDRITEIDDVDTVGAIQQSGSGFLSGGGSSGNSISMYVLLKDDKTHTSKEIGSMIKDKTSDMDCEVTVKTATMDMSALGGSGIAIEIKGDNLETLKLIAKDMGEKLQNVEGTTDIDNGLGENPDETKITIDKNKAMENGLTVAQVYQSIASFLSDETSATKLNVDSKEYPVVLVNDDKDGITRESLKDIKIKSSMAGVDKEVPLSDIAEITEEPSLSSINRDSQVRNITVKASVDENHNVGLVSSDVKKIVDNYDLPSGCTMELKGEDKSMRESFTDLIKMMLLAIVFIYLIMVAQFQSLLSPFIVMFTIPLAFTGGFLALFFSGFEVSMISLLGFLILSGIVVNNGIVFVDYVNQLRLSGVDKREALIRTGRDRLRPILMTALTTILGLSTMAMGIGMGSDMVQPMAVVVIGGLTYATIMTLIVVPVMYDILNKKPLKEIVIDDNEK